MLFALHRLILIVALSVSAAACTPTFNPESDAEDAEWVRQAFPKLVGRRLHSLDELRVYTDLLSRYASRTQVARAIIAANPTDYRTHWRGVLLDHLWVDRSGPKRMRDCYGRETRWGDSAELAEWVRDTSPTEIFGGDSMFWVPAESRCAETRGEAEMSCGRPCDRDSDCDVGQTCFGDLSADPCLDEEESEGFYRWTMADLLSSSLILDDLTPLLRAHLFAMVGHPLRGANNNTEQARRQDLSDTFHKVFVGRKPSCLGCHNSAASVTADASGWPRHFPLAGFYEKALYGDHFGLEDETEVHNLFRTPDNGAPGDPDGDGIQEDVHGGMGCDANADDRVRPWGVYCNTRTSEYPLELCRPEAVPEDPLEVEARFLTGADDEIRGNQVSVWDLETALREGIEGATNPRYEGPESARVAALCESCGEGAGATVDPTPEQQTQRLAAFEALLGPAPHQRCGNNGACHDGAQTPRIPRDLERFDENLVRLTSGEGNPYVEPGEPDSSELYRRIDDCVGLGCQMPQLPAVALSEGEGGEREAVRAWIQGMPASSGCDVCGGGTTGPQDVRPAGALAALARQSLVNSIHKEIFGTPLVISNYFPRNLAQQQRLHVWSELMMRNPRWSLKSVVVAMVASQDLFNRQAPAEAGRRRLQDHYEIWPLFDPWTPVDPDDVEYPENWQTTPNESWKNSVADGVHRHTPRTIVNQLSEGLGWEAPGDFEPSPVLAALGQRINLWQPGFSSLGFSGLIQWENYAGACQKPPGTDVDWIDRLVAQTNESPITVETAFRMVKHRLVNDDSLEVELAPVAVEDAEPGPAPLLQLIGGAANLDIRAGDLPDLEEKLRIFCGANLMSPHYLLAGMPAGIDTPRRGGELEPGPCLDGEACGYAETCERVRIWGGLQLGGGSLVCPEDDGGRLRVQRFSLSQLRALLRLCPRGRCGFLPLFTFTSPESTTKSPVARMQNTLSELDSLPKVCDPTCDAPGCCGRMPDWVLGMGDGLIVAPGAGGLVVKASGVWRLSASGQSELLEKGAQLKTGDMLMFEPGAVFKAKTPMGAMRTSRKGLPAWDGESAPWLMLIVEPGDSEVEIPRRPPGTISYQVQEAVLAREGARWGAAGARLLPPPPSPTPEPTPEPLCPGEFAVLDGTELFTLDGKCGISSFFLGLSCPVVKLWPFGDNGDNVEFEFLSKTTAATSDANIGGSSNVYCEIEVFPGDPILLELVCGNPSSASCDSLFEVSPQ